MEATIFDFKAKNNKGEEVDFSQYKGKVLLIVNTASKCGFTPQYKGLEELYKKYKEKGLVIIGFPCNQFAHQESGNDSEIAQFCEMNFGVSFPLMSKIEVNGKNTHPVYKFLKKQAPGFLVSKIKWNFTKFLVSKEGSTVMRYSPVTTPVSLEADIESFLAK
ncbi:glutathione peroxidase [uncultured Bacteroides sp.]|uniref:glutathione peroxidase n=1 Tax=uncultured Bacteroides sp. TaxID=162156 RepID=UPI002AA7BCE7|nr:glutathione peroxidase [uncultured Bacteroides sp.]